MKASLDHPPEAKQQDIQTIARLLRDALNTYQQVNTGSKLNYRVLKTILFDGYAKGNQVNDPVNSYISDDDILVIVNQPVRGIELPAFRLKPTGFSLDKQRCYCSFSSILAMPLS